VNAAKYTPANGKIELVATEDGGDRVVVSVVDNGIGIPPEAMHHMFDMYFQSRDADGRSSTGLGIGLNVVHRLVEAHGGVVRATSDGVGRGSMFTVELPRVRAS
jgi:signal transduction histidine kinase